MLRLLYGGTFDPVHAGHLAVARAAHAALGVPVHFLPSADPPHRAAPGASAEQRARMVALAIAGHPGLALDRRELHRAGPSYTVTTLRESRAQWGASAPLAWLIGADAFHGLPTWHDWRALFDLAHFVVVARPDAATGGLPPVLAAACADRWTDTPADLDAPAGRIFRLAMAPHPASATALRKALRHGVVPTGWLPPAVAEYIRVEGLYREGV